jgi:hypothetical protein
VAVNVSWPDDSLNTVAPGHALVLTAILVALDLGVPV